MLRSVGLGSGMHNVTPAVGARLPSRLVAKARLTAMCARWVYGLEQSGEVLKLQPNPQDGTQNLIPTDHWQRVSGVTRHEVREGNSMN